MKIKILGTGTSIGVPEMACHCAVCKSDNPRDKRFRTSAWIQEGDTSLLVDCGPDFRTQALLAGIEKIDGVILTHEHNDHVGGLDDLRPFCAAHAVPVYCQEHVANCIVERMPYSFGAEKRRGTPTIDLVPVKPGESFKVGALDIMPFTVMHGMAPILGFRIGRLGYITDMKSMDSSQMKYLEGVDTLIVNALHIKEHPTHQNLRQAVIFAEKVNAARTYFIHMSHRVGLHDVVNAKLPESMTLAYDGLEIEVI